MVGSASSCGAPLLGSGSRILHVSSAAPSTPRLRSAFQTPHPLAIASCPTAPDDCLRWVCMIMLRSPPRCNYDALRRCGNECPVAGCAASNRFRLLRRDCERQRLKPSRFFCCLSADSVLHAHLSNLAVDSRPQERDRSASDVNGDCVGVQWQGAQEATARVARLILPIEVGWPLVPRESRMAIWGAGFRPETWDKMERPCEL